VPSAEEQTSDYRRTRLGLIILLVGVLLMIATLGLGLMRDSGGEMVADTDEPAVVVASSAERAEVAVVVLVYGTVLLFVFVVATVALVVVSRNYRRHLARRKPSPTPVDDVWSRHRVPEEPPPASGS
jgi:hypothetical protein